MFLSELKLWNFRKYGIRGNSFEQSDPGLSLKFKDRLNVLIGENDSGKTAIVDAIKYVLRTQSGEWIQIKESDFHTEQGKRAEQLKIECVFRGFTTEEAARFLEWVGFEDEGGENRFVLKVRLVAKIKESRVISDTRAGHDPIGTQMDGDARSLLRVTYLKPLRDAENELTPGQRSRFAQILKSHALFQKKPGDDKHQLESIVNNANEQIEEYFKPKQDDSDATPLMSTLQNYLDDFFAEDEKYEASVKIPGGDLSEILRSLLLLLDDNPPGLGSSNLLFMAAELLLLQPEPNLPLKLALIEELEAHLHPQAQLRLIHNLEERSKTNKYQLILTTHSTTLGSSIKLENVIICRDDNAFSMGSEYTKLLPKDYEFLQRFLDATKANLFFARGVLLVEGDAENLLIPTIAKIIGRPLHRYGVSIVNVGSTAFSHYAQIFHRRDQQSMGIKVGVVTDMDVRPLEWMNANGALSSEEEILNRKNKRRSGLEYLETHEVKVFVSPNWTLEYEIALSSLNRMFYRSLLWAEKKSNSKTGDPKAMKIKEVYKKAVEDFASWMSNWKDDPRQKERVAFEIYQRTMVDKEISKAVTAQVLASYLERKLRKPKQKEELKTEILRSPEFKYLVEAICHVTKPLEISNGSRNN